MKISTTFLAASFSLVVGSMLWAASPPVILSTYLGGNDDDYCEDVVKDSDGNIYVALFTGSTDLPLVNEIMGFQGSYDAWIAKIAPNNRLVYATYIGGTGQERVGGIALDSQRNLIVVGWTTSPDFPLENAIQPNLGGGSPSGFISKISPDGGTILFSTYFGGTGANFLSCVVTDSGDNIYFAGRTNAENFPVQHPLTSCSDWGTGSAFAGRISEFGSLDYSTCIGLGSLADCHVNPEGQLTVAGWATTEFYPLVNPIQDFQGSMDSVVSVLTFDGSDVTLEFSTYIGGSDGDSTRGMDVDSAGFVYLTGQTRSVDYPVQSAYQALFNGDQDGFLTKIHPASSQIVFSTFLGGSDSDTGRAVSVDHSGSAYVFGTTSSADFPVIDPILPRGLFKEAFVTKFSPAGVTVDFSSPFGGSTDTAAFGGFAASDGSALIVGDTHSDDFPLVSPLMTNQATTDAFLVELASPAYAFADGFDSGDTSKWSATTP